MVKKSNSALLRGAMCACLMVWVGGSIVVPNAIAQGASREQLDDYLGRLVTEIRASVPDLSTYEPFLVLHVLHDERGYRVQASDLLERRFTTALADQRVRVIDQQARQLILEELEACYTEEAPFCRASDVVGRFQTAGGIFEGWVLPVRGGTEFRAKLVVATGNHTYFGTLATRVTATDRTLPSARATFITPGCGVCARPLSHALVGCGLS